eukprot:TRINITY_DN19589_c0_g1_i1.p2 TRINITY_DN19589_c0_g1~~TRINITY_DN19589_c0_g1_i1.p2  ORF type:complete len:111 (-),score=16.80 TRINITY_DN19589_c0_g1_i1:30-362(-)
MECKRPQVNGAEAAMLCLARCRLTTQRTLLASGAGRKKTDHSAQRSKRQSSCKLFEKQQIRHYLAREDERAREKETENEREGGEKEDKENTESGLNNNGDTKRAERATKL